MKARVTLLGHPVHQMLVVIPLGLWAMAVIFDVITMFRSSADLSIASYWNIVAGCIAAVVVALFGLIDWTKIPNRTRAKKVGLMHAGTNVAVLVLFIIAAGMRSDNPGYVVTGGSLVIQLIAFALAGLGGWFGGELVDAYGIGVHEGAHPDAPGSLGGRVRAPAGSPGISVDPSAGATTGAR